MKKAIKTVLIILGFLCLTVVVLPLYLDVNFYKPQILANAKHALGRDIKIDGKIEVGFLPRPFLSIENVHLSNVAGGSQPDMASIKKLSLNVSILPLLKKEIEFYAVKIEDADILLETLPGGKQNWDFSSFKLEEAASPTLLFPPGAPLYQKFSKFSLCIKDLEILKGNLRYKEGKAIYEIKDFSSQISFYSNNLLAFLMRTSESTEKTLKTFESSTSGRPLRWPSDMLDLKFLNHFDMTVEAKGKSLLKNSMKIEHPSFKACIKKGVVKIEEVKGSVYGGEFKVTGQTDGQHHNSSRYTFSLREGELQQIIPSKRPIRIKQGKLELTGEITTQGNSLYRLIAGVDGKIELKVYNAMVNGLNLESLTSNLMKQNRLEGIIGLLTSSFTEGQTAFSIPASIIDIQEGIATIKNLRLGAKEVEGTFNGSIDLLKYIMNIEGVFRLTSLKEVPPLRVTFKGPLDAPGCLINSADPQWYVVLSLLNIPRDALEIFGLGATKTVETLGTIINKLLLE